ADHLDALDHVQRRNVVELVAAEVVRVDVAVIVLAPAVDQDQRVVRAHAAHADGFLAGLVGGFPHVHAFQVAHRVDQGDVGARGQLLAGDHADAGGRVGDLLLEAGGGDHHGVEVDRAGVGGRRRRGEGGRGQEQGEGAGERGPARHGVRGSSGQWGHVGRRSGGGGARSGAWRAAAGRTGRGGYRRTTAAGGAWPGGAVRPASTGAPAAAITRDADGRSDVITGWLR